MAARRVIAAALLWSAARCDDERLVAALRRRVERAPTASALRGNGTTTWAVVFAGEARTFVRISERVATRLVAPLANAECYFVVDVAAAPRASENRWAAAFDGFAVFGLRQLAAPLLEKRRAAFGLFEAVERAVGRRYARVLSTRPDVDHLAAVDGAALSAAPARANLLDLIGAAPRAAARFDWPTPHRSEGGGGQGGPWHVRMDRVDPVQTLKEWWLAAPLNELRALRRRPDMFPPSRAVAAAARACGRYETFLAVAVREHAPLAREWEAPAAAALLEPPGDAWAAARAAPAFELHRLANAGAAAGGAAHRAALDAAVDAVEAAIGRGRAASNAAGPSSPVLAPLEAACGPPRLLCGRDGRVAAPADVRAFARDLCDRGRDPAPEGYFLYHSPAATVPKAFYEYDRWNPPP